MTPWNLRNKLFHNFELGILYAVPSRLTGKSSTETFYRSESAVRKITETYLSIKKLLRK